MDGRTDGGGGRHWTDQTDGRMDRKKYSNVDGGEFNLLNSINDKVKG